MSELCAAKCPECGAKCDSYYESQKRGLGHHHLLRRGNTAVEWHEW